MQRAKGETGDAADGTPSETPQSSALLKNNKKEGISVGQMKRHREQKAQCREEGRSQPSLYTQHDRAQEHKASTNPFLSPTPGQLLLRSHSCGLTTASGLQGGVAHLHIRKESLAHADLLISLRQSCFHSHAASVLADLETRCRLPTSLQGAALSPWG